MQQHSYVSVTYRSLVTDLYDRIKELLAERGIDRIEELLQPYQTDEALETCVLSSIRWYDDQTHTGPYGVGPGLLVKRISDGGIPGYKQPAERRSVSGTLSVTPDLLHAVRSAALSTDGLSRQEIRLVFAKKAAKLGVLADQIIDAALDPIWKGTPPHPCALKGWVQEKRPKELHEIEMLRYEMFVNADHVDKPDFRLTRKSGESDWEWSMRFWGYSDPPKIDKVRKRLIEEKQREKEELMPEVGPVEPMQEPPLGEQAQVGSYAIKRDDFPTATTEELDGRFGKEAPW